MRLARLSALARSVAVKMRPRKRSPWRSITRAMRRTSTMSEPRPIIMTAFPGAPSRTPAPTIHSRTHELDGFGKPFEHRLADQKMPDIEFDDLRQARNHFSACVVQSVTGVHLETEIFRQHCARAQQPPFRIGLRGTLLCERVAPRARVQLDDRCAQRRRGFDLRRLRGNEQGYANAGMFEIVNHRRKLRALPRGVEATFGGALAALFWHQTGRMRPGFKRNAEHFFRRRHFKIQRLVDLGHEPGDIVIEDVAAVFAQMRSDAVATCRNRKLGRANRIGMTPPARITNGGDMIDVDAEAQAGSTH